MMPLAARKKEIWTQLIENNEEMHMRLKKSKSCAAPGRVWSGFRDPCGQLPDLAFLCEPCPQAGLPPQSKKAVAVRGISSRHNKTHKGRTKKLFSRTIPHAHYQETLSFH